MKKASELFEGNNSSLRRAYDEATCKGYTAGCLCEKCLKTDDESIKEEPAYIGGVDLTPNKTEQIKEDINRLLSRLALDFKGDVVEVFRKLDSELPDFIIQKLEEQKQEIGEQKVEEINISYLRQWLNEDWLNLNKNNA